MIFKYSQIMFFRSIQKYFEKYRKSISVEQEFKKKKSYLESKEYNKTLQVVD